MEKGILAIFFFFFEILFISSFFTSSARFSKFDVGNVILFQIKAFGRNFKETALATSFIKVTAHPSFTRFRVVRRINWVHHGKYVTNLLLI